MKKMIGELIQIKNDKGEIIVLQPRDIICYYPYKSKGSAYNTEIIFRTRGGHVTILTKITIEEVTESLECITVTRL